MTTPTPLMQKYESAYYCSAGEGEHYVIFQGIRSRLGNQDEALEVCEKINRESNLPDVNVYRSSTFKSRNQYVS